MRVSRLLLLLAAIACDSVGGTVGGTVAATVGSGPVAPPAGPDAPLIPPPPPVAPRAAAPVPVAAVERPTDPVSLLNQRIDRLPPKTPGMPRVLFFGDSLTSGFGLAENERAFPEVVAQRLADEGVVIEVVNAGIPNDTTLGGRQRIGPLVLLHPDLVVIELGGNDFMMGLPLDTVAANLRALVKAGRDMGAPVVLVGLRLPPGLGSTARGRAFESIYPALAAELSVPLVPDLLEDVLGQPRFVQADGFHPSAEGHKVLAANVLPVLRAAVADLAPAR